MSRALLATTMSMTSRQTQAAGEPKSSGTPGHIAPCKQAAGLKLALARFRQRYGAQL